MSAIEDFISEVFNEYGIPLFEIGSPFKQMQDAAYAELAQLRANSAEYKRIAELIDPNDAWDQSIYDQINNLLHDDSSAEIIAAPLRADVARLTQECDAAQAAVNEARIILRFIGKPDYPNGTLRNAASNWLAAHPAPELDAADLKTMINLGATEWRAMEEEAQS